MKLIFRERSRLNDTYKTCHLTSPAVYEMLFVTYLLSWPRDRRWYTMEYRAFSWLGIYYRTHREVTHFDIVYELLLYHLGSLSAIKSLTRDTRVTYRFIYCIDLIISMPCDTVVIGLRVSIYRDWRDKYGECLKFLWNIFLSFLRLLLLLLLCEIITSLQLEIYIFFRTLL